MNGSFYESDRALAEYLLFHYGAPHEVLPWAFGPTDALNYPVRCVTSCLDPTRLPAAPRALDLGCAVGRSTFELARLCPEVVGVDYSHRFIATAQHLQRDGSLPYAVAEEGALTTPALAQVPPDLDRHRVTFEQGDAQQLRPDLGAFDVVLLANLLDRLHDPRRCLRQLPALVRPGGQLIITTPCTWLEDYTPPDHWLGGFSADGQPIHTRATLETELHSHFALTRSFDLPFLLREHARKYQWSVALATVWTRR